MRFRCIERHSSKYRKDHLFQALDGGYGWIIVLSAGVCQASHGYMFVVFVLLFAGKLEQIGSSTTGAVAIVNLYAVSMSVAGLISGPTIKHVSYKAAGILGSIICFLGYVGAYFATNISGLIFGIGILGGLGAGCSANSNFIAINTYFKDRRGWAVGLALTGGSISQIVMPQIISILQRTLGHNATILTLGAVTLNGGVMAQLYHPLCEHGVRRKETEESSEQLKPLAGDDKTYKKRKGHVSEKNYIQKVKDFFDLDLLTDPIFLNISVLCTIAMAVSANTNFLIPMHLMKNKGITPQNIALCMTIRAVGDITSRTVISWFVSRLKLSARCAYLLSALCLVSVRFCVLTRTTLIDISLCFFLEGIGRGISFTFGNICYSEHCSQTKLPNAVGLGSFFKLFGFLSIGPLSGYLRDKTGDFILTVQTLNAIMSVCIALWFLEFIVYYYKKKRNAQTKL